MRDLAHYRHCLSALLLSFLLLSATAAAATKRVGFDLGAILVAARSLPPGDELRIEAVPWMLDGTSRTQTLRLERFEVFAPESRIVLHTAAGELRLPQPANVYLRGALAGVAGSRVVLSVLETGDVRGLATATGRTWLLGSVVGDSQLRLREVDGTSELGQLRGGFRCLLEDIGPAAFRADAAEEETLAAILDAPAPKSSHGAPVGLGLAFDHTAVIAIETDQEFLALSAIGGNTTTATNYIADLVAYSSTIYSDEVQTSWVVGDVSLWQVADPWAQANAGCGLLEFGRYWNLNHGGSSRTVAHFLSGKPVGSGIAWVGVLCRGAFSANPADFGGCAAPVNVAGSWGGGYGFTGGIDGDFDIDSPSVLWDIVAFTHEIGHNFNSPHTHCYENLGGTGAAIDHCYGSQTSAGCYIGSTSLPASCPGSGQGCGTIMSYCHLLSGGFGNVSLTLGLGHPYGVASERVPSRMRSHVVSVAAGNPACLAPIGILFVDGFASGSTSAWSSVVP